MILSSEEVNLFLSWLSFQVPSAREPGQAAGSGHRGREGGRKEQDLPGHRIYGERFPVGVLEITGPAMCH